MLPCAHFHLIFKGALCTKDKSTSWKSYKLSPIFHVQGYPLDKLNDMLVDQEMPKEKHYDADGHPYSWHYMPPGALKHGN
jgi:hypothetical protein